MRRVGRNVATLVMALILVLVTGCIPAPGEITPIPTPEEAPILGADQGIIEIRVTDPPPADVEHVFVTLANIEVHRVSDNVSGWETIPIPTGNVTFDLMEVTNGVTELLGSANVTEGKFTQIRMDVEAVDVVFVTDNTTYTVKARVPSGKLKIVRPFTVEAGVTTVLTLDFDGKKSLILPGKDIATGKERAIFKPVIKLLIEKEKAETEQAQVQEQEQEQEQEREFEGTIEDMPADAPWLGEWVIDGQTVIVDADTVVEGTPEIGLIAKVKALVQPDDSLLAIKIGVEEEEEELEEIEIEGNIGDMPADAPWLGEWVIDGQTVIVDADTVIEGTPEIGLIAKVKALVQLDDSLLAIKIEVQE